MLWRVGAAPLKDIQELEDILDQVGPVNVCRFPLSLSPGIESDI
jgi:hypothetical protein